jgi:hypothetical protein
MDDRLAMTKDDLFSLVCEHVYPFLFPVLLTECISFSVHRNKHCKQMLIFVIQFFKNFLTEIFTFPGKFQPRLCFCSFLRGI